MFSASVEDVGNTQITEEKIGIENDPPIGHTSDSTKEFESISDSYSGDQLAHVIRESCRKDATAQDEGQTLVLNCETGKGHQAPYVTEDAEEISSSSSSKLQTTEVDCIQNLETNST